MQLRIEHNTACSTLEFDSAVKISHLHCARRVRRVTLLLAGVVVLSLADLLVTIVHISSTGMLELNPLAVYLVRSTDSTWPLVIYKLATLGVCVGLLFRTRQSISGEIGCWLALAVLSYVSIQWYCYTHYMHDPMHVQHVQDVRLGDRWLMTSTLRQTRPAHSSDFAAIDQARYAVAP